MMTIPVELKMVPEVRWATLALAMTAEERRYRRRSARIVFRVPLIINQADPTAKTEWELVETSVISKHGALVRTQQVFPVGATLDIRVQNSGRSARARVVWRSEQKGPNGCELAFEIIDEPGFWEIGFRPDGPDSP